MTAARTGCDIHGAGIAARDSGRIAIAQAPDTILVMSLRRAEKVDEKGEMVGYEDVFNKIELCRRHYERYGLGADYVNPFIR